MLTHQEASADLRGPWLVGRLHHEDSSLRPQRLRKGRHQELRQVLIDTGYHYRPGRQRQIQVGAGEGEECTLSMMTRRAAFCAKPRKIWNPFRAIPRNFACDSLTDRWEKTCAVHTHRASHQSTHTRTHTHTHTRRAKVLPMDCAISSAYTASKGSMSLEKTLGRLSI